MKILYAGMKYDYGFPERGLSFEHCTFFESLAGMGHEIVYFDFMALYKKFGVRKTSRMLVEAARKHRPELAFFVLFRDELRKSAVRRISASGKTLTVNWFCDDHWRFESYSRFWGPCFNWVVTTHRPTVEKYRAIGCKNVHVSQWACNDRTYRPVGGAGGAMEFDVSFVGQAHGDRKGVIERLRAAGIRVEAFGTGWENGRVDTARMVEIFSRSRINLNFTGSSRLPPAGAELRREVFRHRLREVPLGVEMEFLLRAGAAAKRRLAGAGETGEAGGAGELVGGPAQIKGRNFEVPGCGGFLLTAPAEDLERYYDIGKEIECFGSEEELADKIRYYLAHEDQRRAIAEAGYRRTVACHTYRQRFGELFAAMGLPIEGGGAAVVEAFG